MNVRRPCFIVHVILFFSLCFCIGNCRDIHTHTHMFRILLIIFHLVICLKCFVAVVHILSCSCLQNIQWKMSTSQNVRISFFLYTFGLKLFLVIFAFIQFLLFLKWYFGCMFTSFSVFADIFHFFLFRLMESWYIIKVSSNFDGRCKHYFLYAKYFSVPCNNQTMNGNREKKKNSM